MELTREEMLEAGFGADFKRINVYEGDHIDPRKPEDRKKVVEALKDVKRQMDNGELEPVEFID